ncbi:MAG: CvpA family protein, partial [Patescibacteria group bacterium]
MNLSAFHGNWVDFAIIAFILFYLWDGWGRGFLEQLLEMLVFVLAFVLALRLYPFIALLLIDYFSFSQSLAKAAGFFSLGIVFEQILANIAGNIIVKIPPKIRKHNINIWLAIIPLFGNSVVIIAFVLTLLLGLPIQTQIKSAITGAKLAPPLIASTQRIERTLGNIFGEALSDTFNFITIPSAPISKARVKLNFTAREFTIDEKTETDMFVLINNERRQRGLPELRFDAKLRDLARMYAKDMFERSY